MGKLGDVRMAKGLPLQEKINSLSPCDPSFDAVTKLGVTADILAQFGLVWEGRVFG